MKLIAIGIICFGIIVSETKGGWMESLQNMTYKIWHAFHDGKVPLSSSITESLRAGISNQWITPTNFSYSYIQSNVNFYLYTRQNWLRGQEIWPHSPQSIRTSNFKPWQKTAILIHGFVTDSSADSVQLIKERFLNAYDMNVIGVDYGKLMGDWWYDLCTPCGMAVTVFQTPFIGRWIAELISQLVDAGQPPDDVHLIGHSLGAHIAGLAGKSSYSYQNIKVGRVTGLDPSSPGFTKVLDSHRLAKDDAKFTDCIFTTAKSIAVRKPLCHANFYANACGKSQPGCYIEDFFTMGGCSHSRVVDLFAESIEQGRVFTAKRCSGIPCIGSGTVCWPTNDGALMGYKADKTSHGLFYTETNGAYPFSQG